MKVFITGSAGFIGFHLAKTLLEEGFSVHGYDAMTDYYDVEMKYKRHEILAQDKQFSSTKAMLEDMESLDESARKFNPDYIIHLAAQAGVRYSIESPRTYIESNLVGTFNVMEIAKDLEVKHLLMASTSSVYGSNKVMPFDESEKADNQLTIYAATKKANEVMAHSYSHLWRLPTTMFRFFTVYGPWGRPDMALFLFTKAMLEDDKIDIYNYGDMYRDFTYVEDLVWGIRLLIDQIPYNDESKDDAIPEWDSLSPVAPYRIVNIGNSEKIKLLDVVETIENQLGIKAKKNLMPIQPGDVPATWADTELLKRLTGYKPSTNYKEGIKQFISWYKNYHKS